LDVADIFVFGKDESSLTFDQELDACDVIPLEVDILALRERIRFKKWTDPGKEG
jgi:hypothetical protein